MPDVATLCGGCLAGALSFKAIQSLLLRNENASANPPPVPGVAARWASPPTRIARDTPKGHRVRGVDPNVALTRSLANFHLVGGMSKDMDTQGFVNLLSNLIGISEHLQNNPRLGIHPKEKLAAAYVMAELESVSTKKGGPLVLEELEYIPGRSNLKVTYPGTGNKTVSFVGSHFDVVPADREAWSVNPFQLTKEDDKLYGRGTTDCLGHVALLTTFLKALGEARPALKRSVVVVFIAGEEGGEKGVGVDVVVEQGKLAEAKRGPVYWVDSADSQPCCGSSGALGWNLVCSGRVFHSGFPYKGINSIELASEAIANIQARFYEDFPPHPNEEAYQFGAGSNMKPTQIECAKGSFNQICPQCTVSGDIRLSPFYEVKEVVQAVEGYVQDINEHLEDLPTRGTWSKFVLPESVTVMPGELRRGQVELKWQGDMDTFLLYAGVAVRLDSEGHKAIIQACRETYATVKPFSVNGSLPLVKMMQTQGFDIQICGFGHMSVYHGVNEYCTLSEMSKAYEVVLRMVCLLEEHA